MYFKNNFDYANILIILKLCNKIEIELKFTIVLHNFNTFIDDY